MQLLHLVSGETLGQAWRWSVYWKPQGRGFQDSNQKCQHDPTSDIKHPKCGLRRTPMESDMRGCGPLWMRWCSWCSSWCSWCSWWRIWPNLIHTYSQIFTSLVTPLPFQGLFHSAPCSDAIQEASGKCRPRIVCLHGCFQSCGPQVMGNGWTCYGNGFCMFLLLILLPIYPDRSIWRIAKMPQ